MYVLPAKQCEVNPQKFNLKIPVTNLINAIYLESHSMETIPVCTTLA